MNVHQPANLMPLTKAADQEDELEPPHQFESESDQYPAIRRLIWLYFWLLLLEGALRKWFLPGLANPLLVIRDPVVILIYALALTKGVFPRNFFVIWTSVLFVASCVAALFTEQDNRLVTLYGLRTNYLHLPLIFVFQKVLTLRDVEKLGRWLLISALPMALLVLVQFRSSPGAWVNVGVGAAEGGQMEVGFGKIRPPGTFSFTGGLAAYLGLVAALLMAWLLKRGAVNQKLVFAAVLATGIMTAVSGSRSVLTTIAIILVGVGYVCVANSTFRGQGLRAALIIGLAFGLLQLRQEFQQGMVVHQNRFETGGGLQHGLIERVLGGFIQPFSVIHEIPLLGNGIGLGTTAAGSLLYGERTFILAEDEWTRIIKESGPIIGILYLALRVGIGIAMGLSGRRALAQDNPVPMLLFCATFPLVVTGQFSLTSTLGFAAFSAGLCFAAEKLPHARKSESPELSPELALPPIRTVRGRSIYAEKLHGE
ncbi:MAG: hypothetical protein WCF18_09650 [Chthoniobacteraceae bacterium]